MLGWVTYDYLQVLLSVQGDSIAPKFPTSFEPHIIVKMF
jgi:hypothetical protein